MNTGQSPKPHHIIIYKIKMKLSMRAVRTFSARMKMKAIVCEGVGGPEVMAVKEVDIPKCGEGEVLLQVEATAVNRADIL